MRFTTIFICALVCLLVVGSNAETNTDAAQPASNNNNAQTNDNSAPQNVNPDAFAGLMDWLNDGSDK
ncbi:hypothetical protein I4U23_005916 [Adineta vaga]|nr:hypothetical protein I4U23_005916 [Adineta vaga]